MGDEGSAIVDIFIPAYNNAVRCGMEHEFIEYVFRDLQVSYQRLCEAIVYANREWDL